MWDSKERNSALRERRIALGVEMPKQKQPTQRIQNKKCDETDGDSGTDSSAGTVSSGDSGASSCLEAIVVGTKDSVVPDDLWGAAMATLSNQLRSCQTSGCVRITT